MTAAALYTPDVLALATSLAHFPLDPAMPLQGERRSRSCGSTLRLGLALRPDGRIDRVGLRAHACAIGQAAAAIFAAAAPGRDSDDIGNAHQAIEDWLANAAPLPDWPGLDAIAAARDYPARHGAILLSWQIARELLSTARLRR